ncbi:MAG: homocysteine S-methyltransferase family protein [Pseudomonadota bacterium]
MKYLTDSGLETTLVFLDGRELPAFAAFPLLDSPEGRNRLSQYYREHADAAREAQMGFIFEAPTWRANPDWGKEVGYDSVAIRRVNADAIAFLRDLQAEYGDMHTLVSGQVGPRGDGYIPNAAMGMEEAEAYHSVQINAFGRPDMVTALTMNTTAEAIGVVRAARGADVPVVIAFTVETDGRLATGQPLGDAITQTDDETGSYAAYFMINCAHPEHFSEEICATSAKRVRGLRANASTKSHEELDEAEELDIGDPHALGSAYKTLGEAFADLSVVGGCCGTDMRHIRAIVRGAMP